MTVPIYVLGHRESAETFVDPLGHAARSEEYGRDSRKSLREGATAVPNDGSAGRHLRVVSAISALSKPDDIARRRYTPTSRAG
jgi:hypothetical protein